MDALLVQRCARRFWRSRGLGWSTAGCTAELDRDRDSARLPLVIFLLYSPESHERLALSISRSEGGTASGDGPGGGPHSFTPKNEGGGGAHGGALDMGLPRR